MPRPLLTALAAVPLLFALAACGGDDGGDSSDDKASAKEAVASLATQFAGNSGTDFAKQTSTCLAESLVDAVGTDALVEDAVLKPDLTANPQQPDTFSRPVAEAYADAILECRDVRAEIETRRAMYPEADDDTITKYVKCVEKIDDSLLRTAIVESSVEGGDLAKSQAYLGKTQKCEQILGKPRS